MTTRLRSNKRTNVPSSRVFMKQQIPGVASRHFDLIYYLSEAGDVLDSNILAELEKYGYQLHQFVDSDDLYQTFNEALPAALIINVHYSDGRLSGTDVLPVLMEHSSECPPVILTSVNDGIEARLEAVKSGADRIICSPLKTEKLVKTLDGLIDQEVHQAIRVLLIDDDEAALSHSVETLKQVGMETRELLNPLDCLKVMEEFNPDVIILEACMQSHLGIELTKMIRLDDKWADIRLILTARDQEKDCRLRAIQSGCDGFIYKPVASEQLVSIIKAKVERARWSKRLCNNLQAVIRESKFQLETMNQHDIVSITDVAGRITSVNDRFCDISGYDRNELLGQNHRILKSNYHTESFYQELWKTISSGEVWHGTICNRKKNGDEYWVESTIVPFLDDNGKPYKYISARTDVTELRESENRLQRSQIIANIGTWDWNIITGDLVWSERIGSLFGYIHEVPETTYENFLAAVHPDDRQFVIDAVNKCVDQGADYNIEHRVVWPDGTVHWVQEMGDVISDENNKPVRMLGVVMDINERKSAEVALLCAKEEAETANRAKSQFLLSMSHELRTPLNAIIGFSQLLQIDSSHPLSHNQLENINEIYKAGNHLLDLINEVLDLARIEAGRIEMSIESVGLGKVVADTMQLVTPLASKRGLEVIMFKDGTELTNEQILNGDTIVLADRTRLRQVLLNLLSNAVKYNTENGKLTITCDTVDHDRIRISISDTGEGLTPEQQSQLFKAFERIGEENSNIEGTGIGLVITKRLVELMGGSIGVDSKMGEGSTFWIELPKETSKWETTSMADKNKQENLTQAVVGNNEQEYTVLYIEDNPANLRLVTQLMGRMGNIHMWSAPEPLLGLDLAAEHKPDLILLDINLPGMDGYEVLKRLKRRKATKHTPVIAISANAMHTDIDKGLKAGFEEYITKPIDVTILMESINTSLNLVKKH